MAVASSMNEPSSNPERLAALLAAAGALGLLVHVAVLHGHRAAALALAGVLARAALVTALAAALAAARVLLGAVVLGRGGSTAALALAAVLARAALVAGLATTLARTAVQALTGVLRGLVVRLRLRLRVQLGTGNHACRDRAHDLREFATVHVLSLR